MSTERELAKLLRLPSNRKCADCEAALTDPSNAWCSVSHGCFVCVSCVSVHRHLGVHVSRVKSVHLDHWTDEEVEFMAANGNQRVNAVLERFVPRGLSKPGGDAEPALREEWIRAKYEARLFALPNILETTESGHHVPHAPAMQSTLPVRLVDFFAVLGIGKFKPTDEDLTLKRPGELRFSSTVLDTYPAENSYRDASFPEHVGEFVFPEGVHLSPTEIAPNFLTFVLTSANGLKMYGASLHVYEEVDPNVLRKAVLDGLDGQPRALPAWLEASPRSGTFRANGMPLVFAPKALTLLSHYSFYNLFREFLQQLYRISLSHSPIPIERYIANFVQEVPLPPFGQIEVAFALPDRTINITRPPSNQLPMVDFSYRPLFTLLSVDNIITVFSCLLLEWKVALCCSQHSLLTPVSEALMSLLFPLVWQGAYIPVMPLAMTDLLEAPVPFLLGIHSRYLQDTPEYLRPAGVVFVNLDTDTVSLGTDDDGRGPRRLPVLPERDIAKLRQKLVEQGAGIYQPRSPILESAGMAFPSNEHLLPISAFATEQGILQNRKSVMISKKGKGLFNVRFSVSKTPKHPVCCSRSSVPDNSILNSMNNEPGNKEDLFSAQEIRGAFLRFFVSMLRSYQDYVVPSNPGEPYPETLFFRDQFIREAGHISEAAREFVATMLQSQMFERFLEERYTRPDLPEIRFFDESIIEKLNRSKTTAKRETPFLDDTNNDVSETYNPPLPSNWGLPDNGTTYFYPTFPHLDSSAFGTVRQVRKLLRAPQQNRLLNMSSLQAMQRSLQSLGGSQAPGSGSSLASTFGQARRRYELVSRAVIRLQSLYRMRICRQRYRKIRVAARTLQAWWRLAAQAQHTRVLYYEMIRRVRCIQRVYRIYSCRKKMRQRIRSVLAVQKLARGFVRRRQYLRMKAAAIIVQSRVKGWLSRRAFQVIKELVTRAQACIRGWLHRRTAFRERVQRVSRMRAQMFTLWRLAHTSLVYRSRFWVLFDDNNFLQLAVHEDELRRLWRDLGLFEHYARGAGFLSQFNAIQEQIDSGSLTSNFEQVHLKDFGDLESELGSVPPSVIDGDGETVRLTMDSSAARSRLQVAAGREKAERKKLYLQLKQHTGDGVKNSFFRMFGLGTNKRRKRQLVEFVWNDMGKAYESAQVVLGTFGVETSKDWVQMKREQRIRADVLSTVQACLISLQEQRRRRAKKRTSWDLQKNERYLGLSPYTTSFSIKLPEVPSSIPSEDGSDLDF